MNKDLSREEGVFDENGEKDGVWTYFNKKGIKEKEVTFEAGQDLIHTYFDSTGLKTKQGKMKDGKEEGMWSFFDEKGNKKEKLSIKLVKRMAFI